VRDDREDVEPLQQGSLPGEQRSCDDIYLRDGNNGFFFPILSMDMGCLVFLVVEVYVNTTIP
jgi:hypothetical protein